MSLKVVDGWFWGEHLNLGFRELTDWRWLGNAGRFRLLAEDGFRVWELLQAFETRKFCYG